MMPRILFACLLATAIAFAGCAQIELAAPVASIDNVQKAKAGGMARVSLGEFASADGRAPSAIERLSVRTNGILVPAGKSFASYLRSSLAVELEAAGLLDPSSSIVIDGVLTRNELDVPAGAASGSLAARFTVVRDGVKVFDKELGTTAAWHASFAAIEAVPSALNRYGLLHRTLVAQLLSDPEFRKATGR
ncbi:hypothetical protein [Ramlibacter sp.]|uniref:hypothetical protein n=1 Tax=Ramlibacter sp. TaxID=1917967 RepID=UPI003D11FC80